jgi:hypothetical protein
MSIPTSASKLVDVRGGASLPDTRLLGMLLVEENGMTEPDLEEAKDRLIQAITDIYSRGGMDMSSFERSVTRITASGDRSALVAEAEALGLALPQAPAAASSSAAPMAYADAVELSCVSGSLRQDGEWVKAERYRLYLKSSSARLDFEEYEGARGFRLFIELEAISSSIRIKVPKGFEVEDRISERKSSTVRNKPKDEAYGDNLIVLSGSIGSSTVRIKYR